jgi:hypothetical protein
MKSTVITILFLLLATNLIANRIDNIKTDEDVEGFLHKQGKVFKSCYVGSIQSLYFDILKQKLADSLHVKPWQKVDFDNNGLTDLLVYADYKGENCLLALIDEGKRITIRIINRNFLESLLFPVVVTIDKQVFLVLHHGCEYCHNEKDIITKTDTLIYKHGDFIEPNFNLTFYKIEKIQYSTTGCFGTCPVFELEINIDRTAKYNAIQYNDKKGKFKTIIDTSHFNAIISLLNYIDFAELKDNYSVNWTDDQSCAITIIYDNNKSKVISDYGEVGTYGLTSLYRKLFALRKNQAWKRN